MILQNSESSGAILVNKPAGMTSADVVNKIKRRFKPKRIGHAGTLDPFATGLLVVLFGKATKLQDIFMSGSKQYRGEFLFGTKTTTDDFTGEVLETESIDPMLWESIVEKIPDIERCFSGVISQVPPAVSAIKVDGERSYKLARRGEAVELKPREVTIHSIELQPSQCPLVSYLISCSKGTYIRSLARDIAAALGTVGCVQSLERTVSDPFQLVDAFELEALLAEETIDARALSFEQLTTSFVRFIVNDQEAVAMRLGRQDVLSRFDEKNEKFALVVDEKELSVAVLENSEIDTNGSCWKIRFMV